MRKPSSYEDCLRAVGHELDRCKFRAFALEEDADAIWVLMLRKTGRKRHKRWHYREAALHDLVARARSRRGTGKPDQPSLNYENTLRLVGHELDSLSCQSLLLMEFNGEVMVRYAMAQSTHRPHLIAFSVAELHDKLREAYLRRTAPSQSSQPDQVTATS